MSRLWLWLEDQPDTTRDLEVIILEKVRVERFRIPELLINRLLELKDTKPSELQNLGFILDVMITGCSGITGPWRWLGKSDEIDEDFQTTKGGRNAGLIFYEKLVLAHEFMPTPPILKPSPVIFLSIIKEENNDVAVAYERIRRNWIRQYEGNAKKCGVAWIAKWKGLQDNNLKAKLTELESL